MPVDPALSAEGVSHNINAVVGFSFGPMAGMAPVLVGFVHHIQAFGSESFSQLSRDYVNGSHALAKKRHLLHCQVLKADAAEPHNQDMKLDSPLFDRIRVKPDPERQAQVERPPCDWKGCTASATHRAPKGRLREKEYWRFCLDHVREYNQSYNFFAGMSDAAVMAYQKDALTGHRPTWKMGTGKGTMRPDMRAFGSHSDPFGLFGEGVRAEQKARAETRPIRNAERKALETLGLDIEATSQQVKMRFKELVKRHHPDANGGDRSTEDRLVEIIQAYNYLKSVGFG
jgi:DnaJ-class molecular chaperone with C-terminal Zn finger domain